MVDAHAKEETRTPSNFAMALGQQPPSPDHNQYGFSSSQGSSQTTPDYPNRTLHTTIAIFTIGLSPSSLNSFCGAMAGAASGVVTCPLDVIKTKLQAQGGFRPTSSVSPGSMSVPYRGLLNTASIIWTQDGIRGMYRGLGPMLLGYLPTWAVYMGVYGSSRDYYYERVENRSLAQAYASITAGACSTLVTNPIWVIKTRFMSQVGGSAAKETRTPWHYKSTLDAFRQMYRAEGLRAFYSGLAPALLGLTHVAIQFPLYEYFKFQFTGLEMGDNAAADHESHWVGVLAATFLSKVCATTATYPHEVLRTRMQTQQRQRVSSDGMISVPKYRGIWSTCTVILKEERWRAFYNGMGTNLVRAVPAAMTTMLTFESLKRWIHKLQDEGRVAVKAGL